MVLFHNFQKTGKPLSQLSNDQYLTRGLARVESASAFEELKHIK